MVSIVNDTSVDLDGLWELAVRLKLCGCASGAVPRFKGDVFSALFSPEEIGGSKREGCRLL